MSDETVQVEIEIQVQVLRRSTEPIVGAGVIRLQQILNDGGLGPLVVDGQFGPKTEAEVKTFQGNQGLKVDGIVGRLTWTDLLNTWLL